MVKRRFQYKIVTGKFTLPVTILLSAVLWITVSLLKPDEVVNSPYPFWQLLQQWIPGKLIENLLGILCHAAICYLLIELNNAYSIIRVRTSLQASLYLLLLSVFPFLHGFGSGCLVSLCVGVALYMLFKCYQNQRAVGYVFHSMLCIGVASLFFPKILFIFPVFLVGLYNFKALSFRTFWAALLALTLPYWFLFGHAYYYGDMQLFYIPFRELVIFQPVAFSPVSIQLVASFGVTVFILLVSGIHYWITTYEDKIRVRTYINFLFLLSLSLIILGVLQIQYAEILLQILLPITALLAGHLFALTNTRLSNMFFVFFIILIIAVMGYNIWILLYNF